MISWTQYWDLYDNRFFWRCLQKLRRLKYYEADLQREAGISAAHFRRMKNGESPVGPGMRRKLKMGLKILKGKRSGNQEKKR